MVSQKQETCTNIQAIKSLKLGVGPIGLIMMTVGKH